MGYARPTARSPQPRTGPHASSLQELIVSSPHGDTTPHPRHPSRPRPSPRAAPRRCRMKRPPVLPFAGSVQSVCVRRGGAVWSALSRRGHSPCAAQSVSAAVPVQCVAPCPVSALHAPPPPTPRYHCAPAPLVFRGPVYRLACRGSVLPAGVPGPLVPLAASSPMPAVPPCVPFPCAPTWFPPYRVLPVRGAPRPRCLRVRCDPRLRRSAGVSMPSLCPSPSSCRASCLPGRCCIAVRPVAVSAVFPGFRGLCPSAMPAPWCRSFRSKLVPPGPWAWSLLYRRTPVLVSVVCQGPFGGLCLSAAPSSWCPRPAVFLRLRDLVVAVPPYFSSRWGRRPRCLQARPVRRLRRPQRFPGAWRHRTRTLGSCGVVLWRSVLPRPCLRLSCPGGGGFGGGVTRRGGRGRFRRRRRWPGHGRAARVWSARGPHGS